ncbi:uncharacterized protein LOC126561055 [Anopheles maculipalpis]|uniref:uncharacterized protein LOC126561055 n=1 Tax=Anopheles maculipalpis TaxID=1496333 RepID=UPI0021591F6B|nr:uncharacterized protein LOC126561055 [Anopheles maculipalpis]
MVLRHSLLTLSLLAVLWISAGCGQPSKDEADVTDAATNSEDEYNPQCLPLDFFEKDQAEDTRAKRDDAAVLAAEDTAANEADEIVAQPGYVVPARRRRPCVGRRRNFTRNCGPNPRVCSGWKLHQLEVAYRVRNFVMAPKPKPRGPRPRP